MSYGTGESKEMTFNTSNELQALGWAASDMYRTDPDDPDAQSAYQSALHAGSIRHNGSEEKSFTLSGEEAEAMSLILQRWVEAGPPEKVGQVTDGARAKSYKTACEIVSKIVEIPADSDS